MTWMTTKVEMSVCAPRVSGSEISWHLAVPFLCFFYGLRRALANAHISAALFLFNFVLSISPWTVEHRFTLNLNAQE